MMYLIVFHVDNGDPVVTERLAAAIKTMGNWSNRIPGTWMLETNTSARRIRDHLKQFMAERDRLFIARISRNWAGRNMGQGFPEWMERREFGDFPNG